MRYLCSVLAVAAAFSTFSLSGSLANDLPHRFSDDECQKMLAGMDAWFGKFEADREAGYEALDLIEKMIEASGGHGSETTKNLSELRAFFDQVSTPPDISATNGDLTIRNKCPRRN